MSALPPNSGHEMAIRDLRSLSVALESKMSALPPKADTRDCGVDVRLGPEADSIATAGLQPMQRYWCNPSTMNDLDFVTLVRSEVVSFKSTLKAFAFFLLAKAMKAKNFGAAPSRAVIFSVRAM